MAAPPRRMAALVAEEINRAELEHGLVVEEEDEELDSDYDGIEDEKQQQREEEEDQRSKKRKRNKNDIIGLSEPAKKRAEELFQKLEPNLQLRQEISKLLNKLLREEAEEEPYNPKKKQSRCNENWIDPMLSNYIQPISTSSIIIDATDIAREVLATFGTDTVQEHVKFAGEVISVSKRVDKERILADEQEVTSGLDDMLQGISKKRGVTTVEKSSYDWEKYKEEKKLNDELQDATKKGFVEQQAFLNRVDERQFENEKLDRERERARREASAPQRPSVD